jgi:hypothetical protein
MIVAGRDSRRANEVVRFGDLAMQQPEELRKHTVVKPLTNVTHNKFSAQD